jgi:Subtilase family
MPHRPDSRLLAALACGVVAATILAVAGPVRGAAEADPAARPRADVGRRMLVVLAAPSLADRMAAPGRLSARQQRRAVGQAELIQRRLLAVLRSRGVKIKRQQSFTRTFNGFSAVLGARAVAALEGAPGVVGVYPVRTVYPAVTPDATLPRPAPEQPAGLRADGSGITVALLDSSVDQDNPSLRGRLLPGIALAESDGPAEALELHGTRMAEIVAGVAPGASILPIQVLGWMHTVEGERAVLGRGDLLLAGLERAVDPDGDGDVGDAARIALVPLVEPYAAFADSPEARAVAGALALGTLVVAAVGNDGPAGAGFGTAGAPGGAPTALAVGATFTELEATRVAPFSSSGPAFDGRGKPDLVAAGVRVETDGATVSGSSAAAAVTAGAAALVAQARPGLNAAALRSVLIGSARPLEVDGVSTQGAGLVDPVAAVRAVLAVEPASIAFGRLSIPSGAAAQTVRIRNLGSRPLRLAFEVEQALGDGALLTFSATPTRVKVRPGRSVEVRFGVTSVGEPARPATIAGALLVSGQGIRPARVPWTVMFTTRAGAPLVGDVALSRRVFSGSGASPAVLSFRAGWAIEGSEGTVVEPVGLLEVELWRVGGKRIGVLARLRDLLPGRYSVGITGRGPDGRPLAPGLYAVRLRALPVDTGEGHVGHNTLASERFTVRRPSR